MLTTKKKNKKQFNIYNAIKHDDSDVVFQLPHICHMNTIMIALIFKLT